MLSRLVCRNGQENHDFWEIVKSKIRHSYAARNYLRCIGFARWFQRIENLFGGNWSNGLSVRDKCPCQFSKTENAAYQYMENGGRKPAHIDRFVAHCACRIQCWDKIKDLDGSLENMLNVFSVLFVTRKLSNSTINGPINTSLAYNCTKWSTLTFLAVTCCTLPLWTCEKHGNVRLH